MTGAVLEFDTGAQLERLRAFELDRVREWFRPGARVLELGGGSGFQANVIASWGCEVSSLDVEGRPTPPQEHFPVRIYDGRHIPFPDGSFDIAFSSNVLEHIRDLAGSLAEVRRALKRDGLGVHVLPTPSWRLWTSVTHYARIPQVALRRLTGARALVAAASRETDPASVRGSLGEVVRRNLLPGPHGEYPSAFSELWYFSRRRWLEVFAAAGFEAVRDYPTGLFYTGFSLMPGLSFSTRRGLARALGSSCRVFVMRQAGGTTS